MGNVGDQRVSSERYNIRTNICKRDIYPLLVSRNIISPFFSLCYSPARLWVAPPPCHGRPGAPKTMALFRAVWMYDGWIRLSVHPSIVHKDSIVNERLRHKRLCLKIIILYFYGIQQGNGNVNVLHRTLVAWTLIMYLQKY